jgi:hypothetical protein
MHEAVAAFARILEDERAAALRADLSALSDIQERKLELLPRLREATPDETATRDLIARAQANIGLMRHLMLCLRGCVDAAEPTYTPKGEARLSAQRYVRAVL